MGAENLRGIVLMLISMALFAVEDMFLKWVAMRIPAGEVLFVLSGERSSANSGAPQQVVSDLLKSRRDSYDAELQQSRLQSRQRHFDTGGGEILIRFRL